MIGSAFFKLIHLEKKLKNTIDSPLAGSCTVYIERLFFKKWR